MVYAFCTDRKFQVHVNNDKSECRTMKAGLGLGAVLSPHLFSFYIADLYLPSDTMTAFYADDTAILASANRGNTIIRKLQMGLNAISDFMNMWKIKINAGKTQFVFFPYNGRRRRLPTLALSLQNSIIPISKKATYLGVILDSKLNFKCHLEAAKLKAIKCFRAMYPILASKSKLSRANKYLIHKCVIQPILLYASPVWDNAAPRLIKGLQVVQNKCLKAIIGVGRGFPTDLLHDVTKSHTITEKLLNIKNKFVYKCSVSIYNLIREIGN